jgi:prolipoprotein diacylglyceryltransferase
MPFIGGVILFVVAVYYVFLGIDTWGLTDQKASAVVVGKGYRAAGTTYVTEIINKRSYVAPQATPEAYLLELEIEGQKVEALVPQEVFEAVSTSQTVEATYQRRRLTGTLQVTDVNR